MINDFILKENPWGNRDDYAGGEIFRIMNEISMDPLERKLVNRRLFDEFKKEGLVLTYCGDLIIDYIDFYKNGNNLLSIELLGLNNITLVDVVGKKFLEVLGKDFSCKGITDYKNGAVAPYTYLILGYNPKFLSYIKDREMFEEEYLKNLSSRSPTLLMELVGSEQRKDGLYHLLVVYDRQCSKHGYVALKV